jgi:hypothetical protein
MCGVPSGRYQFEGELGAGGVATVYLGADLKHQRKSSVLIVQAGVHISV